MFVLTVDQRGSRRSADRVPEAIAALHRAVPGRVLGFERTAGDELQGVVTGGADVVEAVRTLLRLGGWSIGIGAGGIERPLPATSREARGDAFVHARDAVEAARRRAAPRICVRSGDASGACAAEAVLRLLAVVLEQRSGAAWEATDLVRAGATHAEAAAALGISRQAVGQRLAAGRFEVETAAGPTVAALLDVLAGGADA